MCRADTGMPKECVPGWDWRNWRGTTSRLTISAYSLRLSLLKVLKFSVEMISCFPLPPVLIVSLIVLSTPGILIKSAAMKSRQTKITDIHVFSEVINKCKVEKRKASSVAVVVNIYPALWTKLRLQFDSLHSNYSFFDCTSHFQVEFMGECKQHQD